jgi:hypothetical protein
VNLTQLRVRRARPSYPRVSDGEWTQRDHTDTSACGNVLYAMPTVERTANSLKRIANGASGSQPMAAGWHRAIFIAQIALCCIGCDPMSRRARATQDAAVRPDCGVEGCVYEPASGCGCIDDGNQCTDEFCLAGRCVHPIEADGNACNSGICHRGMCCGGCWDGSTCRAGNELAACGSEGLPCTACAADPCSLSSCRSFCATEPVNGPGCPACGEQLEPCCAGSTCLDGLICTGVPCGEDCFKMQCQ